MVVLTLAIEAREVRERQWGYGSERYGEKGTVTAGSCQEGQKKGREQECQGSENQER